MARRVRGARRTVRGPAGITLAALLALAALLGGGQLARPQADLPSAGVAPDRQATCTVWDAERYPDYFRVVGPAVVDVEIEPGEVVYEGLDELGRTGRVVALVTPEMAEAGSEREREDMSDVRPSGWGHNAEVDIEMPDGKTYHGYLFNRSHLLAKSLGGDDAVYNVVTGTRTQNVGDNRGQDGGMAYAESLARDWLRDNPGGSVFYSAEPVYEGDELVPRSVIVDVRSSDGSVDQEIEVFNAAAGYEVNYETGEFSRAGE